MIVDIDNAKMRVRSAAWRRMLCAAAPPRRHAPARDDDAQDDIFCCYGYRAPAFAPARAMMRHVCRRAHTRLPRCLPRDFRHFFGVFRLLACLLSPRFAYSPLMNSCLRHCYADTPLYAKDATLRH